MRLLLATCALGLALGWTVGTGAVLAGETSGSKGGEMFPFVLPWDDSTGGIVDLSGLLPRPAGRSGQVRAGADGHLWTGDTRIRFFGVDLAFSANFPTHAAAERIAARLAKFGVNIVRFHIMDMRHFPEGLLARGARNTRDLDDEAFDRLDYFSDQLTRRGIYVNLCLLNYRPINAADGLPPEIEQAGGDPFQGRHVVGFFDQRILDLQKEYARKLLLHRNPYTKRTYAEDPGVAFVEINNENGLIHAWLGKVVDALPEIFGQELRQTWNRWVARRYGTTQKLRRAWAQGEQPAGSELLINGDFARKLDGWMLERHEAAEAAATMAETAPESLGGAKSVRLTVVRPGTQSWHVRFEQKGLSIQADRPCTLSFWAKADRPCTVSAGLEQTHAPWHVLGPKASIELTEHWRLMRVTLGVRESDTQARLVLDPPMRAGTYWLAGVSLRPDAVTGLGPHEHLEGAALPAFSRSAFEARTAAAQRDWIRFLWEMEDAYWQAMYRYLKDELKVRPLVIGTAVGCSTPNLMAKQDCVDSHAYWQHPIFPGRPWDGENWIVPNRTMVNARGGMLTELAMRRVLGKPFCVTEYGHPAPNTYVSEGHLLRSAYGALQDWDYTSASRYAHHDDWDLRRIRNFFDIDQHPTKMATLVPAAAMFLRGDVQPARQLVVAAMDKEQEVDLLRSAHVWQLVDARHVGVRPETSLIHRVAIAAGGTPVPAGALAPGREGPPGDRFVSDTGQLDWDLRQAGRGVVTVNAARSKAVIGFGGGKRFDLGGVVIEPGATMQDGWSTITLTVMEGELDKPPCRILVTATGQAENTGMKWKDPQRSSVGRNWGEAPSLVEGIAARITLPFTARSATIWPLDERGQRRQAFAAESDAGGHAIVPVGPQYKTIWYEIEAK